MLRRAWDVIALAALLACNGKVASTSSDESSAQGGVNAGGAAPTPTTIPMGPARPPGAVGTTPCSPLAQPTNINAITPTKQLIVGHVGSTVYVIDDDPERPGRHRAFIQRYLTLERHALSEDGAADTFIIDRGLPNQILLTKTHLKGAGFDDPLAAPNTGQLEILTTFANDSPESLAYATAPRPYAAGTKHFFVLGPVAGGVLGVPRVFYGLAENIQERAFLGFNPPDSSETATAATSVTFDVDGTPTTLPTIVKRETQGLINGFNTVLLTFFCF